MKTIPLYLEVATFDWYLYPLASSNKLITGTLRNLHY